MALLRSVIRSFAVLALLACFALAALCSMALPASRARRRARLAGNAAFFARLGLRVIGIRLLTRRRRKLRDARKRRTPQLIVANHLSYTDILIISSLLPSVFITSRELKSSFPLGFFAWLGGCLFVERRNPAGLKREIREIAQVLAGGTSVTLFPEGTTSNGDTVRPFKNSLLTAAISTGAAILPVCIRYRAVDGKAVTAENRDSVFYYGATTFFEHLPRLLALRAIDAECVVLAPVPTHQHQSRKELAARAHAVICAAYHGRTADQHRAS